MDSAPLRQIVLHHLGGNAQVSDAMLASLVTKFEADGVSLAEFEAAALQSEAKYAYGTNRQLYSCRCCGIGTQHFARREIRPLSFRHVIGF